MTSLYECASFSKLQSACNDILQVYASMTMRYNETDLYWTDMHIYTFIYIHKYITYAIFFGSVVRLGFYLFAFTVPSRCSTHMAVSSPAFILTSASRFCLGFHDSFVILQITTWWVSQEMIQVGYIHTHIYDMHVYIYICIC